ncbi:hypothetical protein ACFY65_26170 [Streptomyces cellulosae]
METVLALIAIVVSVFTAVGTFIYTHQQMREARTANALTKKAQQEQVQPYVIADIRERVPGSQVLTFIIENTGPTMARDVQLKVDPPLRSTFGADAEATLNAAVTRKISVLPPGRSLSFFMDVGHKLLNSDLPLRYTVEVKSGGPFGAIEALTYTIDLGMLKDSLVSTESLEWSTRQISKEAEKIRKAYEKQATATAKILQSLSGERDARLARMPEPPTPIPPSSSTD